jgi:hypothetical protein
MANKKITLGILAAAVLFCTLFIGCEFNFGDIDDEDELLLNSGYAWVTYEGFSFDFNHNSITIGFNSYGLVFKSNGYVDTVEEYSNGKWQKVDSDRYIIDGDHMLIGEKIYDFRVDDDDLRFDNKHFEKEYIGSIK